MQVIKSVYQHSGDAYAENFILRKVYSYIKEKTGEDCSPTKNLTTVTFFVKPGKNKDFIMDVGHDLRGYIHEVIPSGDGGVIISVKRPSARSYWDMFFYRVRLEVWGVIYYIVSFLVLYLYYRYEDDIIFYLELSYT